MIIYKYMKSVIEFWITRLVVSEHNWAIPYGTPDHGINRSADHPVSRNIERMYILSTFLGLIILLFL